MNKAHFIKQKAHIAKGSFSEEFTPYMLEYYKHECKEKGFPILINDIQHFNMMLRLFMTIPVTMGDTPQEMMMNSRPQTIDKGIKKVLEFFDKEYKIQ